MWTKRKLYLELTQAGYGRPPITIKNVTGYLASIEREDGSLATSDGKKTVHLRTVD